MASFYLALSIFVATTIAIGLFFFVRFAAWIPTALGFAGTLVLFFGCLFLMRESRLAIQAVNAEMAFARRLQSMYENRSVVGSRQSVAGSPK